MQLALKIHVDTYRGTLRGVPELVDILRRHKAGATFCFAMGTDHAGLLPATAKGKGAPAISRLDRYGFKSLLYGQALPGPVIGKGCADIIKATAEAGFEAIVHGWNLARWQQRIAKADATWTEIEMRRAHERFAAIFASDSLGHAAPGWQMNRHALRLTQRLGYLWSADSRGHRPFLPVWNGELIRCPQIPTTLPTLDELVVLEQIDPTQAHSAWLARTATPPADGHVLTLHAELEGLRYREMLELLLTGLREQGYALVSLGQLLANQPIDSLPRHEVRLETPPGAAWPMLTQGDEFLAQWKDAA